jgi:orotidine-5'-phosphate decarboxylase
VTHFADAVAERVTTLGAPCLVGLDPRHQALPAFAYRAEANGLGASAAAVVAWAEAVIEAVASVVPVVKPQSAFYEALGADGWPALKRTISVAHAAGLLVLLDVKRSDIGSTAEAYADAVYSASNLDADAVTAVHYCGREGIDPFKRYVHEQGKGLFVLVHTSNPSASETQEILLEDGRPYYEYVTDLVAAWGADCIGQSGYSAVGAVVGATYPEQLARIRSLQPQLPLLIPGFGQQGGTASDVASGLTGAPGGALVAASRSICDVAADTRELFVDEVRRRARAMVNDLRAVAA